MDNKLITTIQNLLDDFIHDAGSKASITSEWYPHGYYVESLGKSPTDLVYLIDEINYMIGNPILLSTEVLDIIPFYECIYYLDRDIKSPLDLKLHKVSQSLLKASSGSELICTIWKHDSYRFIQIIFDKITLKNKSVCEVIEKYNSSTKKLEFIEKEIK